MKMPQVYSRNYLPSKGSGNALSSNSTTCESRDSNPDGLPHWILSANGPGQRQGAPPTDTYRSVLSRTLHEQKYDEKYDACEKSELLPEPYAAGGIRIPNLLIHS
jgi:hypothetical protein